MTSKNHLTAKPLPDDLRERYLDWKSKGYTPHANRYQALAQDGQTPREMVIACCDSRILPTEVFGAGAGDIFMQRNVAAFVPAKDAVTNDPTAAALQFAVTTLGVERLIVMGHSNCGGVEGCYTQCETGGESDSYVGDWVGLLRPAYDRLAKGGDRATRVRALEKQSVLLSLENLMTFPWIAEGVAEGRLELIGLWIDIASGLLEAWSAEDGVFQPV